MSLTDPPPGNRLSWLPRLPRPSTGLWFLLALLAGATPWIVLAARMLWPSFPF